jgi:voltage-gated potassium channel
MNLRDSPTIYRSSGGRSSRGNTLRDRLYRVVFESDTTAGRTFDVSLLVAILLSVSVILIDSVAPLRLQYGPQLAIAEWFFTGLFTVEYLLRMYCSPNRFRYATSFFGIIDLLAIAPTYISLLLPGMHYLLVVRILRMLRIFRIFKLTKYLAEADVLASALRASRPKITVFIWAVLTIVVIVGALMYVVEGQRNGFDSIPRSIYWAIVTLTTVGYGDMSPQTPLGQLLASVVMILGYGIIAVPTGIMSVELRQAVARSQQRRLPCPNCASPVIDPKALFCCRCGADLDDEHITQK